MAVVINMPRLSDTMEEGVVAKWLKQKGDKVLEGDILAEIETDKATMEFESFHEGTLLHIGIQEGDGAPVDSLLAIIGEEGEDISSLLNGKPSNDSVSKSTQDYEEESKKLEQEEVTQDTDTKPIPKDVEIITMPRLSDTMEEGTVATWLKKIGDTIDEGDILAEIETDKATMEFESFYTGVLLYVGINEGESAPVDEVLAIIGPDGTDIQAVLNNIKLKNSTVDAKRNAKQQESTSSTNTSSTQTTSTDVRNRIFISPLARKMAQERGYDLSKISGSGENGRIIKKDIENYTPISSDVAQENIFSKSSESQNIAIQAGEDVFEEIKNSSMRKTIARRLTESKFTAPHYYLNIEVNMDNAIASRKMINAIPDTKISFNDLVIKASAMALRKHPQVNSQWHGEITKIAKHIHIGVAVAVEEGLVVPVLEFADTQSLTQIGYQVKELATKARTKKLQPSEMEGSTFTVSNLGMFGITEFTSIINHPNSAILSVGTIQEKPLVNNGEIVVGNLMKLTLACDHRTVDGATGAKFLQTLKTYIENPVTMLA